MSSRRTPNVVIPVLVTGIHPPPAAKVEDESLRCAVAAATASTGACRRLDRGDKPRDDTVWMTRRPRRTPNVVIPVLVTGIHANSLLRLADPTGWSPDSEDPHA